LFLCACGLKRGSGRAEPGWFPVPVFLFGRRRIRQQRRFRPGEALADQCGLLAQHFTVLEPFLVAAEIVEVETLERFVDVDE
jgi:hypothetical protein